LLDTHIWLWSLLEPTQLHSRVARALSNPESELWLSPISTWETLVLVEKGHLTLKQDSRSWIDEALASVPIREAPLTHEIAIESRYIDVPHADPADRFLVATAQVLELTLITADERLLGCKSIGVLSNH
jgi:PIN domain nuclease of toxin-antitoxin system